MKRYSLSALCISCGKIWVREERIMVFLEALFAGPISAEKNTGATIP
jgi:hypothetical protein